MFKRTSLTLHIESVENGYILKDLSNKKEGAKPETKVSTNVDALKAQVDALIKSNLTEFTIVGEVPLSKLASGTFPLGRP